MYQKRKENRLACFVFLFQVVSSFDCEMSDDQELALICRACGAHYTERGAKDNECPEMRDKHPGTFDRHTPRVEPMRVSGPGGPIPHYNCCDIKSEKLRGCGRHFAEWPTKP